jgi:hypothetical protein
MAEQQKLTPAQKEALDKELDRQTRKKEEKAPTTATTMGEGKLKFKKGGYVRAADGIAQRGKTKGRLI